MTESKKVGWGARVVVVGLVLLVAGAWSAREVYRSKKGEYRADADAFAQRFHQQMDAGRTQEIVAQADAGFRDGKAPEELRQRLEEIRGRLGPRRSSKLKEMYFSANLKTGRQIVTSYETEFEKGRAHEDFTLLMTDGGWKLYGYQVSMQVPDRTEKSSGNK